MVSEGVLLIGDGGVIHRMNPAAERMLGYPADELTELWDAPAHTAALRQGM